MTNLEKLFKAVANFLDDNKDMDVPYLSMGKRMFTKRDLVTELDNNTDIGQKLVNDMVKLAIDLTARAKEKSQNFTAPVKEEENENENITPVSDGN